MCNIIKACLILPLLLVFGNATETKQRVCVIGAGLAGLVSAKHLAMYPDEFEPIVFEKQSDTGGLWIYTDSDTFDRYGLPVHSSAYKNLRSNAPKEIIVYPGYDGIPENRSFVTREKILQYIQNFTDHFDLRKYIQFDTNVEKVSPLDDMKWLLTTRNLIDNEIENTTCDAVMIASGNTATGNIPNIPGLETFPGRVFHSHFYRTPDSFANQTVAVLGASYSGMDIGIDISKVAKIVYISHRHNKRDVELPENMIQVPGIVAAENDNLILSNGSRIKADVLLFATGYIFDFPFLDETSGIVVEEDGKYIRSLHKHIVNIERPTMGFLNIPDPGFPLLMPHSQVQYYVAILRGKIELPSQEEMMNDAEVPEDKPKNKAHFMVDVFPYMDELSEAAGYDPLPSYYDAGWKALFAEIAKNPWHFQDKNLYVLEDGTVDFQ